MRGWCGDVELITPEIKRDCAPWGSVGRRSGGQTHVRGARRGCTGQGEARALVKGVATVKRLGGDAIEGFGEVELAAPEMNRDRVICVHRRSDGRWSSDRATVRGIGRGRNGF